ncbi:two-component system sensor histidine kinase LiaS [Paenibacillus vulneris]|uniref:Oxygen sensor histidine kinase NreB n=1 Tax=Paenibacillus vulneris TaxID=1133364 RepID=A0ABW3UG29_9BACL
MKRTPFMGIRWKWVCVHLLAAVLVMSTSAVAITALFGLPIPFLLLAHTPTLLGAAVLIAAAGTVPGYVYGGRMKRKLEQLADAVYHYERGYFTHRVPGSLTLENDETGVLSAHLNTMAERVELQVESLQRLASEKSELGERLKAAAVLEERQRIARDLHDAVSQQLFAITMMTSALAESEDLNADKSRKRLAAVQSLAEEAQKEMRALLLQLRPAVLQRATLKEGFEELLQQYAEKHDVSIQSEIEDLHGMAGGVADHLVRILQESLSNAAKHSQAASITVKLFLSGGQIHLKITDDGIGFDKARVQASSYGLRIIRERAVEIGGVADIVSVPGAGTQIHVLVPCSDREQEQEGERSS